MNRAARRLTVHEQVHLHATGKTKCPVWDQFVVIDSDGYFARNRRGYVVLYDNLESALRASKS